MRDHNLMVIDSRRGSLVAREIRLDS